MKSAGRIDCAILSTTLFLILLCSVAYGQSGRTAEPQKPASSEATPSLQDTLKWLKQKIETVAGQEEKGDIENYHSASFDGCSAKYVRHLKLGGMVMQAIGGDKPSDLDVAFNLKDIAASTIEVKSWTSGAFIFYFKALEGKRESGSEMDSARILG